MLTKAFILVLVMLIGLALGLETTRYVHAHIAGGVAGVSGMVNIHRALLGFSLLATSGALLLSLRGAVVGVWLSRLWSRFTARLELTLDGLFDFDALNVGDGASALSESARGLRLMKLYKQSFGGASLSALRQEMDALHRHPDGSSNWQASNAAIIKQMERRLAGWEPSSLLPCRGCSWCGVDPGDLPDELWTECDGSGLYLSSNEAERKRQLAHPKLPASVLPQPGAPEYEACAQDALDDAAKTTCTGCGDRGHWSPDCPDARPPPSREGKQPDGSYVIEVGPNETHEDVARRHPAVLFIQGDVLFKQLGVGPLIVRRKGQ